MLDNTRLVIQVFFDEKQVHSIYCWRRRVRVNRRAWSQIGEIGELLVLLLEVVKLFDGMELDFRRIKRWIGLDWRGVGSGAQMMDDGTGRYHNCLPTTWCVKTIGEFHVKIVKDHIYPGSSG